MPPTTAIISSGEVEQRQFLSELTDIQKSIFDQASNYTKLVLGLGYAGFFAAWSGTKARLGPVELVGSALLMCLSLFAYIVFEIFQARFFSRTAIDLARTLNRSGQIAALQEYKRRTAEAQERYFKVWSFIFPFCAGTGILGAIILIGAFLHSLWKMI